VKVITTLKFKVVNESVKKTDKDDAVTIAEFPEKDMLPEARLCMETSERLCRLLKIWTTLVRTIVIVKNQVHALLTAIGMEDEKASLQNKKGYQKVLAPLESGKTDLVGTKFRFQPLFDTIEWLDENIKSYRIAMLNDVNVRNIFCLVNVTFNL
jgi:hypothetical protein